MLKNNFSQIYVDPCNLLFDLFHLFIEELLTFSSVHLDIARHSKLKEAAIFASGRRNSNKIKVISYNVVIAWVNFACKNKKREIIQTLST